MFKKVSIFLTHREARKAKKNAYTPNVNILWNLIEEMIYWRKSLNIADSTINRGKMCRKIASVKNNPEIAGKKGRKVINTRNIKKLVALLVFCNNALTQRCMVTLERIKVNISVSTVSRTLEQLSLTNVKTGG